MTDAASGARQPTATPSAATLPLLAALEQRAAGLNRRIVLCEGDDARVLRAGVRAHRHGLARIILAGDPRALQSMAAEQHVSLDGIAIEDPASSPHAAALAEALHKARQHKGLTAQQAVEQVREPLVFAHMMVAAGLADGSVAGAVHTTADVVRTALQTIGAAPSPDPAAGQPAADQVSAPSLVSSFFLMVPPSGHPVDCQGMIFTDCGLVVDPSAQQLAQIAQAGARSAQQLLGEEPRVAMLSFSTNGSAAHPMVDKVREATERLRKACPDLSVDGEIQLDAALVPDIAKRKLRESRVVGRANVLVFPDLNAGNIGYKLAERLGGVRAIGPMLQGLRRPANDLSRGCSEDDILASIVVTSLQGD